MNNNIILETKLVGSIEGDFIIKSYQRGYRWSNDEVKLLLEDIYFNGTKDYCLQPIVVKKENGLYELIDGQQRLTTLYLIYQYMHTKTSGWLEKPKFSIDYQTRQKSKEYLEDIDITKENKNIDFWHISNAYKVIDDWFSKKEQAALTKFNQYLTDNVKVIWYVVDDSADSNAIFRRLNIGKIPLTSAELVKAMFLSKNAMNEEKQEEISLQWDNIERRLQDDSLWFFLTNNDKNQYQTRIELLLDLLTSKKENDKEKYYSFFEIDKMRKNKSLQEIWNDIEHTFLILTDWYENHKLYHKIGYLITSKYKTLQEIYELSKDKTKEEFIELLDYEIKNSIKIKENYGELTYENTGDQAKIFRLLLLFNIESVSKNGEHTQWFPFDKFKDKKNGKVVWSLEHIHAQQSDGLKTTNERIEWLEYQLESIKSIEGDNKELIEEMKTAINNKSLQGYEFRKIQEEVFKKLSTHGNISYMHTIGNLALLNSQDNAALNNSTFDVKRNKIIELDKKGQYIPFCTRMVFLKYYTPSKGNQLHFWEELDMKAYINDMNRVLNNYLEDKIVLQKEEL